MIPLGLQFLGDAPEARALGPERAREFLRAAFDILPIKWLMVGWGLDQALYSACRAEAERQDVELYLWYPLLAGYETFLPAPEEQVANLEGRTIVAWGEMAEFTFFCPNKPAVRERLLAHLRQVIAAGYFDGVFLDRIRFPSCHAGVEEALACFCADCEREAAGQGLDLPGVRHSILSLLVQNRQNDLLAVLLDPFCPAEDEEIKAVKEFMAFRAKSITRFVSLAAGVAREMGLKIGLDCFSPAIAWSVGQALGELAALADWTKIMSYCHTNGPAGLPFELDGLARWLQNSANLEENRVLQTLASLTGLPLPLTIEELLTQGLPPATLSLEVKNARSLKVSPLLVGIELVEVKGVANPTSEQIRADLQTVWAAEVEGVILSWDLLHIPLERLMLVAEMLNCCCDATAHEFDKNEDVW